MAESPILSVPYYMGDHVGDLEVPEPSELIAIDLPDGTRQERMAVLNRSVAGWTAPREQPIVYAADCVVITGMIAGLQRRRVDPVVVFYDAHGDFNTWDTTPSGFIGGMPLAMVTGRGEQTIVEGAGMRVVPDSDVFLVGARDLDPGEQDLLEASGVTMVDVAAVAAVVPQDRDLYVHIDVDVVNPDDLPAINYPAAGGPSTAKVAASVADVAATGRVVAFSVSTWNPGLPGAAIAAAETRKIARPFL